MRFRFFNELFSARTRGHRAQRLTLKRSQERSSFVDPSLPTRAFREHTDLDQLKRQAKELLEAFRAGDAAAVTEVSAHLRGADPATFALHDAQLVLARAYGFASWPRLKAYVDGVNAKHLIDAV